MKRLLIAFLAAAFLLLVTTFAGMSVFGMGMGMDAGVTEHAGRNADACVEGGHCADAHHSAPTDCVDHCLSSIPSASLPTASTLVLTAVLTVLVAVVQASLPVALVLAKALRREGIGKILLRRKLATVILRD